MTLNEGDTILTIFTAIFTTPEGPPGDFLGHIKATADGKLEAGYRFRYHKDTKLFDSGDKKSFYRIDPVRDTPEEREKLKGVFRAIFAESPFFTAQREADVNSGDPDKLVEVMRSIGITVEARAVGPSA